MNRTLKLENGFSLVEGLIAAGLGLLLVLTVSYFITQSKSVSKNLENSSDCQNLVNSVLDDFKSLDNKALIYNNLDTPTLARPRTALPFDRNGVFNNFQNIEGAVTKLFQAYLTDNNLCTGISLNSNAQLLQNPALVSGLRNTVTIQTLPYDFSTGTTLPCASMANIRVLNASGPVPPPPGIKLVIKIDFTDNVGAGKSCQAETVLGYEADKIPPATTIVGTIQGIRGGTPSVPVIQPQNTICDTPDVQIPLTASEAGSLFVCSNNNANFTNCQGFSLGGRPGRLTLTSATQNAPTTANLIFSGLPEGRYTLFVKTVDTAGNLSALAVNSTFTIDLTRPVWTSPLRPYSSAARKVVDFASEWPQGSTFPGRNDRRAVLFGNDPLRNYYQCLYNGQPQFSGTISTSVGNEFCGGRTSSPIAQNSNHNASSSPANGGSCILNVDNNPAFTDGPVRLDADVWDVCNAPPGGVPAGAQALVDWTVYVTSIASEHHIHDFGLITWVFPPKPVPAPPVGFANPSTSNGPGWTLKMMLPKPFPIVDPPVVWEHERSGGGQTRLFLANQNPRMGDQPNVTAVDQNLAALTNSCYYSQGFCALAWGPCGQNTKSNDDPVSVPNPTRYAVMGKLGSSCWNTPCDPGLSCNLITGRCQGATACGNWKCTNNNDCGNNNCSGAAPPPFVFNSGVCRGNTRFCNPGDDGDCVSDAGVGYCGSDGLCHCPDNRPVGFGGTDPKCPNLSTICGPGVTPACSCDAVRAATLCPTTGFPDSCGNADFCRGTNANACASCRPPLCPPPLIVAACSPPPGNGWLGAGSQRLPSSGTGGVPPTNLECSTGSASGPWQSCTQSNWPESPSANSPNVNYWVTVTDSRGDWDRAGVCKYKLDRTPPQETQPPFCDTRGMRVTASFEDTLSGMASVSGQCTNITFGTTTFDTSRPATPDTLTLYLKTGFYNCTFNGSDIAGNTSPDLAVSNCKICKHTGPACGGACRSGFACTPMTGMAGCYFCDYIGPPPSSPPASPTPTPAPTCLFSDQQECEDVSGFECVFGPSCWRVRPENPNDCSVAPPGGALLRACMCQGLQCVGGFPQN